MSDGNGHQRHSADDLAQEFGFADHGAALLDDVRGFIRRFCAFPDDHALTAATLWAAHAHMIEWLHITPRLALLSPEPASGKSRVLEILELLTPDAMLTINASPPAIFRSLENRQITLLFDEIDAVFNKRGKDDTHEDLRALINAGYKRGATILRCVGPRHDVTNFPVFCAVALAGLGDLPDTIMSRSVIIRMRRRAPSERVEEFRTRRNQPEGHALRDELSAWAAQVGASCGDAWPTLPPGIVDRPAEIWEPLIAVADAAGGHWPTTARDACLALCRVADDRTVSLGIRLLSDLRIVVGHADALYTETILRRLTEGDDLDADAPWSDLYGKSLGERRLASMLKKYDIKSEKVRERGGRPLQGYRREHLWDAWQRYLPSPVPAQAERPEQAEQANGGAGSSVPDDVPDVPDSAPSGTSPEQKIQATARVVPLVPDVPDVQEPERQCPACAGEGCGYCGDTGQRANH
ncbi:MAG: DUF3631 domain-containing protein [Gammaproteobacteria bacterium]|nr:DUF3631 domain-containing protein [Gammaproteobacteria bacterium]